MTDGNDMVRVSAGKSLTGDFHLPGDKSISHRSAMFAAIAGGPTLLRNYSSARDCRNTLECMATLGIEISQERDGIRVHGQGLRGLRASAAPLDAGNSGTTVRLLSGILAGQPFTTIISGDESIQRRPMKRVIEPLTLMGAKITARENNFAPLSIAGGNLRGVSYEAPVASAQVKSCVLLAGLYAAGATTVIERTPTRNHTEIMLRECGVAVSIDGERITMAGGQSLRAPGEYTVAGDLSSAAFFLTAALLVPGSELTLRHIGANPSRIALVDVLREAGARIEVAGARTAHGEPVVDFVAAHSRLGGDLRLHGAVIANLIDEIPILAVAATRMEGTLTVREARELRVKESDRINAIVTNLRRMGAEIEEFDDGFSIRGPQALRGATVESRGDHRIAMAFAIAGLLADGETTIAGAGAAAVSLPEFYELLARAGATVTNDAAA
ncbi:MAG: 3-phosphoshikimate 1-carboxyvinyltransferase [Blastocatellia bacterium]